MLNRYFDQLDTGEKWFSGGRTITESDIVMFAALSGDWYPLHTNKEWASATAFKQRIAHGMLLLSVATGLMEFKPGIVIAFYGMDKVRFVSPVFIGDTISLEMEVIDKNDKDGKGGVVTVKVTIFNQRNETAVSAAFKFLLAKSC
ncbi:MAG: MaoC family dehydratase N-terminal domain-containing protein [Clostridiales bacterium]|jgi:acyl dehydratase|nr:MaoC family dehydratase N-terminal domain-containing protein [Clostridiales bacterium]